MFAIQLITFAFSLEKISSKVKVGFLLSKLRALTQMKEYAFSTYHFWSSFSQSSLLRMFGFQYAFINNTYLSKRSNNC